VTGEPSREPSAPQVALAGEVRRLPPSVPARVLSAITLVTLLRALGRAMLRYTLGYRARFALTLGPRELILERERVLLGRTLGRARTVLPLARLQEITLERKGESPAFTAGLVALGVGTFLGTRLISEGLLAPGGAPWLLGIGALLFSIGVLLDFFVGSGRTPKTDSRGPQVVLKSTDERGWVLSHVDAAQAEALIFAVENALATGEPLPERPATASSLGPTAPLSSPEVEALGASTPQG
jgi:hypothetical protein